MILARTLAAPLIGGFAIGFSLMFLLWHLA
jgi:hypothetical protein